FIVDDAEPIEDVQMVMVDLDPNIAADIEQQHRLRNVIRNNQGNDPKYARVPVIAVIGKTGQRRLVRLGAQFRVQDPEATINALARADFKARMTPLINA
ncbi:MAG: trans-splicing intein-formed DNA polymerase III subunit alpha C-terminal partner DnaE-C, partial [Cyanobacteria bacterium P01_H01_bin.153]